MILREVHSRFVEAYSRNDPYRHQSHHNILCTSILRKLPNYGECQQSNGICAEIDDLHFANARTPTPPKSNQHLLQSVIRPTIDELAFGNEVIGIGEEFLVPVIIMKVMLMGVPLE